MCRIFNVGLKFLLTLFILFSIFFIFPQNSKADNPVLFFDDFSSGNLNNWNITSGNWVIDNGNLLVNQAGVALGGLIYQNSGSEWDNYTFEFDVNNQNGVDEGISFRNDLNGNYYDLTLRHGTGAYDTPMFVLHQIKNNVSIDLLKTKNLTLLNNNWYHVKISANFENIKVWINNNLIVDVNDPGTTIKKGSISFTSWTGDIAITKVRFDNVKVTSLNPVITKTPVIIIPGVGTSSNWKLLMDRGDSGWDWMVTTESGWRQFIDSLEKAGYQKDKDYFIAFYDWRKTNDWTDPDPGAALPAKKYLEETIDKAKTANPGITKVNVVAHSMGGLVVRSYVESPNYRGDIDKAFLIGSPNNGSTFAYYTWEGGVVPPNWDPVQKAALSIMIKMLSINFLQEPYQMIHDHIKSIKDLLPVGYNYLSKNNNFIDWTNMQEINNFLKNTSNAQNTANIFTSKGVQLTNITGTGQTTWEKLQVEDYLNQYLWKDGKPIGNSGTEDGDNTVLKSSSILPNTELLSVASKHANLPNSATSLIFNKLGINYTPSNLAGAPDEVMVAWVASPVTLSVKDNSGNSVGELLTDPETDRKWVFVENPTGDYKLDLTGTGAGEYHVGVDYYTDTKTESSQTQGTAITGAELNYDLHLDTQNPQPINLQPEDKIAPITTARITGTSGKNNWYLSDVNFSLLATDNTGGVGLDKTEYSFDNTTWQTYITPVLINKEDKTVIYYRSKDLVGNLESTKQAEIKIDKTAPEAKISFNIQNQSLEITGTDNLSNVSVVDLSNADILTDEAGNTTRLRFNAGKNDNEKQDDEKGKEDKEKENEHLKVKNKRNEIALKDISYNNNPAIKFSENEFQIKFELDKKTNNIKEFKQELEIKKQIKIDMSYNSKKNITAMEIETSNNKKQKVEKNGLIILQLTTNKGILETTY